MRPIRATGPARDIRPVSRPQLSISLFGSFALSCGDRLVTIKNKKAQALLAYLLLSPSARESRERLVGLLWSESSEERARGSLRQTLHATREIFATLGFDGLQVGREDVGIDKSHLQVDVWAVLDMASRHEVHPLLLEQKRLTDNLLPGFEDLDPSFRVWLIVQRQTLKERLERHLENALATVDGGSISTKPIAVALLHLDPTHEEACRRLMQAYAEQGDIANALKVYKALWDLLDEEYGTEPSDRTKDLVVRIKNNEFSRTSVPFLELHGEILNRTRAWSDRGATRSDPFAAAHSVLVVSEFDSRGVEPDYSHLVYGLRHELIAKLVRFRDWTVLDGRGLEAGKPVRSGSPETHYFSLDATLRQATSSLGLVLTIKEQPYGRFLWSDSYVLDLEHWFDIQHSVVRRIALTLNVHLSAERLMSAARHPDISLGIYDRWLRGQQLLFSWQASDRARAAQIFQSIIVDAPQFAPAYVGLVQMNNAEHLVFPGVMRTREKEQQALALAKTAVQADPFDSRAHLCLAWSYAMNRQFDQAERNFELALDLNENDPWTLISAGLGMAFCGNYGQALELAAQAHSINLKPSKSHWGYQAVIQFMCGNYAECASAAENAQDIISNVPAWHAAALSHLGHVAEAAEKGRQFLELIRSNWHGTQPPSDEAISSWLLHCFPIRHQVDWERLREGLNRASVPVMARLSA